MFEQTLGRAVAKSLPPRVAEVHWDNKWVRYWLKDSPNQLRWGQIDLLVVGQDAVLVGECKLTQQFAGRQELNRLYLPLVRHMWPDKAIVPVLFFSNPTEAKYHNGDLQETVEFVAKCLTHKPKVEGVIDLSLIHI